MKKTGTSGGIDFKTDVSRHLAGILLTLWALSIGVSHADEPAARGVNLSEAMRSAASGDQRDLGGRRSADSDSDDCSTTTSDPWFALGFTGVCYDQREFGWQALADVSYSLPINDAILGITHFTLTPFSVEDEENFFGLYVGGAAVQLKPGSLPDRAVDRTWMLEAGLAARHYFNCSRPAFSPYVAVSVGCLLLNWDYHNQIYAGGDAIQSDSLLGAEGTLALGISTRRDRRVCLFGEVGIGGTLLADTTTQGFNNDVFHNFGFLSFKAGLSVKF